MRFVKPKHLIKGDAIGIVSPSSTIANFPRRLARGIKVLEDLGLKVVLGKNAKSSFGHNAGTVEERAEDINNFFADSNIKAIICSTGGWNANAILPALEYRSIRNHPKIFCGFSDITVLNLAITHKTGLVTFNGPTVLPTFGEFGGPLEFTVKYFKRALFDSRPLGELESPEKFTEEILWWEKEDSRKRKMVPASPPRIIYKGTVEGILLGGNLNSLCILGGTEYFPDFTNVILFLEDEGESTSSTERYLVYLEQLGVFNKIKGLIYGRPFHFTVDSKDRDLYDILEDFGKKYKIPILADVDIGHTDPLLTLPLGIKAKLDTVNKKIMIIETATF